MAAATPDTSQIEKHVCLKLVLNEKGNKVLFAEAGKDFVDILCSFLTMPLGTIARLVEKESSIGPVTVGCLNSLYHSVANLDEECMWNGRSKQMLLQPNNSSEDYCSTLQLNIDDTPPTQYFICNKSVCPKSFDQGFVNRVAKYILTDNLIVMPNCIDYASFGLLQEFGIRNPSLLKEMVFLAFLLFLWEKSHVYLARIVPWAALTDCTRAWLLSFQRTFFIFSSNSIN